MSILIPYDLINTTSIYFKCSHFEMLIIYNIYYLYMKNFKLQTIYIIGTQLCTINVYWTVKKIYTI